MNHEEVLELFLSGDISLSGLRSVFVRKLMAKASAYTYKVEMSGSRVLLASDKCDTEVENMVRQFEATRIESEPEMVVSDGKLVLIFNDMRRAVMFVGHFRLNIRQVVE